MTVETTQPSGEAPVIETNEVTPTGAHAQVESETPPAANRTVEEVEAEWRNRVSQKDKAHAAEAKALRDERDRLTQADEQRRKVEAEDRQKGMTEAERVQDQIKALEQQLETERQGRVIDARKARFPNVAAELDDAVLAATDEGRLAALEAKLSGPAGTPPSLIDPNSASRSNGSQAIPRGEQTSDDLKAELERSSEAFKQEIANR